MTTVVCFHCGRPSDHAPEEARRETHCPHCRGGIVVPAKIALEEREELCLRCRAMARYVVSRDPRWIACPRCGARLRVPGGGPDGMIDE